MDSNRILFLTFFSVFVITGCSKSSSDDPRWLSNDSFTVSNFSDNKIKVILRSQKVQSKSVYHYDIYRSSNPDSGYEFIGSTSTSVFFDSEFTPGTAYYYKVYYTDQNQKVDPNSIAAKSATPVTGLSDPCFGKAQIRSMKSAQDVPTFASLVNAYYATCASIIEKKISIPVSSNELKIIVASFISHSMLHYGGSSSHDLGDILHDTQLDCDNYVTFTGHIYELLSGSGYTDQLTAIGFDDGYIGNHAQLLFEGNERSLILDPTIGLIAFTSYQDLIKGVSIDSSQIFSLYNYWDDPEQPSSVESFYWIVKIAFLYGYYRQSDAIYFIPRPHGVNF